MHKNLIGSFSFSVVTRHREVCPNQYEVAPIFEKSPKASDHNVQLMELMDVIARRHNLACLFHEKPFAHVNGSGKHNNWSMGTDVTGTLFEPGKSPDSNLEFLMAVAAVIRGADMNPELLRWCISGAGNDHRLGGHEARMIRFIAFLIQRLTFHSLQPLLSSLSTLVPCFRP